MTAQSLPCVQPARDTAVARAAATETVLDAVAVKVPAQEILIHFQGLIYGPYASPESAYRLGGFHIPGCPCEPCRKKQTFAS